MPPAPPMLPEGYNFARTAWFEGLAATGSVLGHVEIEQASDKGGDTAQIQARLSQHVRTHVGAAAGAIAATLASGDRGAIPEADAQAMRDSGLAHLLSISGLHVSAVIAIAYVLAIRLLAFWPWLALRVRLPIMASAIGASAGLGYTMLTGAQVPTVRSCVAALLVLGALALGREALSTRMLAVAAFVVLMLWPESIVGPSFQMSFAAVLAIIALNTSEPVKRFLGPRDEGWFTRGGRYLLMLFVTGLVIELALMPIALFHFHRAGIYGAFANVIAIPLTTIVVMPLIGLALAFDLVGLGAPAWWLVERAISALLSLAHFISSREGAVTTLPSIGEWRFGLFVGGGIWMALWNSRIRYLGLMAAGAGAISLAALDPPDILVSGDGRQIGIPADDGASLFVLRDTRSDYVRDNFTELAGMRGRFRTFAEWEGARCTPDFCSVKVTRGTKDWHILVARSHDRVPERALAAACDKSDIVIADRWLPRSCRPRWLKADRDYLSQTGGLAIDLERQKITSVADTQGEHGWWRGRPGS